MRMALRTRAARKVAAIVVTGPLVLLPLVAGPAAALPAQDAATTVEATIENKFVPETLTVPVGATVTWINKGGVHTVAGGDNGVPDPASPVGDSPLNAEGETITKTFDTAGTYPYYCTPHVSLGMKGVIVVTAAAAGGAAPSDGAAPASSPAAASAPAASGSASPAASGSASPAAPADSAAAGTATASAAVAAPAGEASPDPNVGKAARDELEARFEDESKPLTSFRLALAALMLALVLLSAGIYFVTKPSRAES